MHSNLLTTLFCRKGYKTNAGQALYIFQTFTLLHFYILASLPFFSFLHYQVPALTFYFADLNLGTPLHCVKRGRARPNDVQSGGGEVTPFAMPSPGSPSLLSPLLPQRS